jgi:hypothetical protein
MSEVLPRSGSVQSAAVAPNKSSPWRARCCPEELPLPRVATNNDLNKEIEMANANFTGMPAAQGSTGSRDTHAQQQQLEKISYSLQSFSEHELLCLRGKRIHLIQRHDSFLADSQFFARIMAVQLPAAGSSVETSVLLLEDGYAEDQMDYVDIAKLTVLEVLQ